MGPLRRQLIALFLLPTQAIAEVCDKEREDWNGVRIGWVDQVRDVQISAELVVMALLTLLILTTGTRLWLAWFFELAFAVGSFYNRLINHVPNEMEPIKVLYRRVLNTERLYEYRFQYFRNQL